MASLSGLGGATLAAAFSGLGRLRRGKPIHPQGVTLSGTLTRHGAFPHVGAPWLDEAGEHEVLARISRSVGLPRSLPDVQGLALRLSLDAGRADLLLAATGRGALGRFVLVPHRRPGLGFYGSLLPYTAGDHLVQLAAEVTDRRELPVEVDLLPAVLRARPLELRLLAAPLLGEWRPYGTLILGGDAGPDLDFDPVLHPLPGLSLPRWLRRLREPAYAAARRTR